MSRYAEEPRRKLEAKKLIVLANLETETDFVECEILKAELAVINQQLAN